jgi:hypothetical protein
VNPDEEYTISCLLMVLLAVSISRLTRYDSSLYKPELQGTFSIFYLKIIEFFKYLIQLKLPLKKLMVIMLIA